MAALAVDNGERDVLLQFLQLVASRTGQGYNNGKIAREHSGKTDITLQQSKMADISSGCLAYIDLNGTCRGCCHPSEWPDCGYHEIQNTRQSYDIIDFQKLEESEAVDDLNVQAESHIRWLHELLPPEGKKWDECRGSRRKVRNQD